MKNNCIKIGQLLVLDYPRAYASFWPIRLLENNILYEFIYPAWEQRRAGRAGNHAIFIQEAEGNPGYIIALYGDQLVLAPRYLLRPL